MAIVLNLFVMQFKQVLFVINPKAGNKSRRNVVDFIKKYLSHGVSYDILLWKDLEMDITAEVKSKMVEKNYDLAVAIGGDGTINRVAQALIGSNVVLGIIPLGSGNGFARHLKVSLKFEEAFDLIFKQGSVLSIDVGFANGQYFFCTMGVGFDAYIGKLFATAGKRGLWTYIRLVIREFIKYKAKEYVLQMNGSQYQIKAFFITCANANQWGGDVLVAPQALINDGFLDVVVFKPFKWYQVAGAAIKLLTGRLHQSRRVTIYRTNAVNIQCQNPEPIHYDGEPGDDVLQLSVKLMASSLKVVCNLI